MPEIGLITLPSAYDVGTTLDRLTAALTAKGVTIFARIDHAAGAASVGLPLRPTTLIIFGNPAAGTPLMQVAQTTGIDLPLKALVAERGRHHLFHIQRSCVDCGAAQARRGGATGRERLELRNGGNCAPGNISPMTGRGNRTWT
jgi:uncharacterized protein (DUF302 family)